MMARRLNTVLILLVLAACKSGGTVTEENNEPVPVNWTVKEICEGLRWFSYRGMETVTGANQVLGVLELDLQDSGLVLEFQYYPVKTTLSSAIRQTEGAIAGVNASFGTPHTFIRTGGTTWCDLSEADPTDSGNWYKHEAAVWFDGSSRLGFINCEGDPYGAIEVYKATTYPNLFSSRPLMIDDFKYVEWTGAGSRGFVSGARQPRTAVAMMPEGKILFITVDGRWYGMAAGMTIAELRDFIKLNFNPRYAINMDGGGSTTMYVEGFGKDGIVNYPCNGTGSSEVKEYLGTFTERSLPTFFIIKKASE